MMQEKNVVVISGEIAKAKADAIVNAANGCGWMGGKRCAATLHKGVAESLNFHTNGKIEGVAMRAARKWAHIPSILCGVAPGQIFTTPPYGLECKEVVHAVTMRYPGSRSDPFWVKIAIHAIFVHCERMGYETVAMPLLGCGTGGLNKDDILAAIEKNALMYPKLKITVYAEPLDSC